MNDIAPNMAITEQRAAKPVEVVRDALERLKPQLAMALPKHLTADRLVRVAMTAVQTTPKLLECDRTSFYRAIMTCAQLGLEPDGVLGQAYLVPFGKQVQFIPGYKGLLTLARNSGDVTSISAHEVCDNDMFEFDFASGDPPRHTFDIRKPRGDVIAFYAVARFKDGGLHWDMMTVADVKSIRDKSQGWISATKYNKTAESPWGAHFIEMGKKTVIRRIAKYLPLSVQKAAALSESYDTGRHATIDGHGEIIIDGDATEAEDGERPALEHKESQLERFEREHGAAATHSPAGNIQVPSERKEIAPAPDAARNQPAGDEPRDLLGDKPARSYRVRRSGDTRDDWDAWGKGLWATIDAGVAPGDPPDAILRDNREDLDIYGQIRERALEHAKLMRALEVR